MLEWFCGYLVVIGGIRWLVCLLAIGYLFDVLVALLQAVWVGACVSLVCCCMWLLVVYVVNIVVHIPVTFAWFVVFAF